LIRIEEAGDLVKMELSLGGRERCGKVGERAHLRTWKKIAVWLTEASCGKERSPHKMLIAGSLYRVRGGVW